jgi:prolyl-tRNA editing enzyme YbaK/EbsC (Cys-tRNA(Pro) deacylase)
MTVETVRAFLVDKAPDIAIIYLPTSTATVVLAAEAHGVAPGQIAKSLLLDAGGRRVMIVTRGNTRIDNQKFASHRVLRMAPHFLEKAGGALTFGRAELGVVTAAVP